MINFERAEIRPLDDGSFMVSISPIQKKSKGNEPCAYESSKEMSASTLEECLNKIKTAAGGSKKEKRGDMAKALGLEKE